MSSPSSPAADGSLQIPKQFRDQKKEVQKRKVSTMSTMSNLSRISTVEEFIRLKEEELDADYEMKKITQHGLEALRDAKEISPQECAKEIGILNQESYESSLERNNFKRYKKILNEDLEAITSELPTYDELSKAYADTHRLFAIKASDASIRGASKKERERFKRKSLKEYQSIREIYHPGNKARLMQREKLCHISGWHTSWVKGTPESEPQDICKVAHIVPHSLATSQTAYLFGIADAEHIKKDPRNSLSLHTIFENMFDKGEILILPIKTERGTPTRWECIVTDPDLRVSENVCVNGLKWTDIHKRELQFNSDFRPANRYMYYKYVTMFLINEQVGSLNWLGDIQHIAGKMWASPGPYLRDSYLTVLARSIGDVYLPEVYFEMVEKNSFEHSDSAPAQSAQQEEVMRDTTMLSIMELRDKEVGVTQESDDERENDDDEEGEEDEEEDGSDDD